MSRERKLELHQLEGAQRVRIEEAIKKRVDELLASQEVQKQIEVCNHLLGFLCLITKGMLFIIHCLSTFEHGL